MTFREIFDGKPVEYRIKIFQDLIAEALEQKERIEYRINDFTEQLNNLIETQKNKGA